MAITAGLNGTVQAASYGVIASTPSHDAAPAFNHLVQNLPQFGVMVELPTGSIPLKSTVMIPSGKVNRVWLRGTGCDDNGGTTLYGDFPGPLLAFNQGGVATNCSVLITGVRFQNRHPQGIGLQVEGARRLVLRDCTFGPAWRGLLVGSLTTPDGLLEAWGNSVSDCFFQGDQQLHPDGIGAAVRLTGGMLRDNLAEGWGTAFQLAGSCGVDGLHAENCGCVIRTGVLADGTPNQFKGSIANVSTEACAPGIVQATKATYRLSIRDLTVWGTGNTATGVDPQTAVDLQPGSGRVTLDTCTITGGWEQAVVRVYGNGPVLAQQCELAAAGGGVPWDIDPAMDAAKLVRVLCS